MVVGGDIGEPSDRHDSGLRCRRPGSRRCLLNYVAFCACCCYVYSRSEYEGVDGRGETSSDSPFLRSEGQGCVVCWDGGLKHRDARAVRHGFLAVSK